MRFFWVGLCVVLASGCGLTESDDEGGLGLGGAGDGSGARGATGGRAGGGGAFGDGGSGSAAGSGGRLEDDGVGANSAAGGASAGGGDGDTGGSETASGAAGGDGPCSLTKTVQQSLLLKTQSDVEMLAGVRRFEGHLYVTGDVTDLSGLACLTEITGEFGVFEARALKSLSGLERLQSVGGLLAIGHFCTVQQNQCVGNPVLEDVSALRGLEHAKKILVYPKCSEDEGGPYDCAENAALERIAFDSLLETTEIEVSRNPVLKEAHFDALRTATDLAADSNPKLETLSFDAATAIDAIYIRSSPALRELAMPELVQSELMEITSTDLRDLRGLGSVESIDELALSSNKRLESLEGLEQLSSLQSLYLANSDALESIAALKSLVSEGANLYLFSNPLLASLAGLENLKHVDGLTLAYQRALKDVEPLSSLETVSGSLSIYGSDKLASLSGLKNLKSVENVLDLNDNEILTSLVGLEAVESVTHLSITGNPLLPTCEAERIRAGIAISGNVNISYNDDSGTCEP